MEANVELRFTTSGESLWWFAFNNSPRFDYAATLCHYTTPEGMKGITKDGKITLWFSQYDYLNDTSEGKDILTQYQYSLHQLLSERKINKELFDVFIKLDIPKERFFAFPDKEPATTIYKETSYQAFVCSFTTEFDCLPMWNGYVKNGKYSGYCLEFQGDMFDSLITSFSDDTCAKKNTHNGRMEMYRVLYDNAEKQALLKSKIIELVKIHEQGANIDAITRSMKALLQNYQLVFKNHKFASENEVRAVYYVSSEAIEDPDVSSPQLLYRPRGDYKIPYIQISISDYYCFRKICLCPLKTAADKKALTDYLQSNGFPHTEVYLSQIPLQY